MQPGHHDHSAPGQCWVPEHLAWLAEVSPCPAPVPPAAQDLFPVRRSDVVAQIWGSEGVQGAGEASLSL